MLRVMMSSPTVTKKKPKRMRQQTMDIDIDGGGGDSAVFDTSTTITISAAQDERIHGARNQNSTTSGFELPVTKEERRRRMDRKVRRLSSCFSMWPYLSS
jgi:hypothetical protein